jgi:LacI family transcriptional regulator
LLSTERHRGSLTEGLLQGIHDALADHNLHLTVARLPDEQLVSEGYMPKILREWSCDGLLINYTAFIPRRMIDLIEQCRIPSIWLNSKQPTDCVHLDDFGAGRRATERLLGLGHRRIAYVNYSGESHYSAFDRRGGYERAMGEAGLAPRSISSSTGWAHSRRMEESRQWLGQPDRPTAVIAYSPSTAMPVLLAATAGLGLRVPEDLSLMTFADCLADESGMAIDSMITPEHGLGRAAAGRLLEKIENSQISFKSEAIPFGFAAGQTCAAFRG